MVENTPMYKNEQNEREIELMQTTHSYHTMVTMVTIVTKTMNETMTMVNQSIELGNQSLVRVTML